MTHSLIIGVIPTGTSLTSRVEFITPIAVNHERKFYFKSELISKLFAPRSFYFANGERMYKTSQKLAKENFSIMSNLKTEGLAGIDRVYVMPQQKGNIPFLPFVEEAKYSPNTVGSFTYQLADNERFTQADLDVLAATEPLDLTGDLNDTTAILEMSRCWLDKTVFAGTDQKASRVMLWVDGQFKGSNMKQLDSYDKELQDDIVKHKQLEADKAAKKEAAVTRKIQKLRANAVRKVISESVNNLITTTETRSSIWSANTLNLI
ncbi:hypothetical protein [Photobacterium leiognathi]|uniref:hypothetical protein n=1 Tax=Photobacterium leiognathi TaxID=553611 RepID=UPI002981ABBE|nr:hypothetical protein [Photobacterium leiognathi]